MRRNSVDSAGGGEFEVLGRYRLVSFALGQMGSNYWRGMFWRRQKAEGGQAAPAGRIAGRASSGADFFLFFLIFPHEMCGRSYCHFEEKVGGRRPSRIGRSESLVWVYVSAWLVRCRDLFISSRACFAIEMRKKSVGSGRVASDESGQSRKRKAAQAEAKLVVSRFQASQGKAERRVGRAR
jgi:hypothetical protein